MKNSLKKITLMAALGAFLGASACQSAGLFLANSANDADKYTVYSDISYGDKEWQKLNIYEPKADAENAKTKRSVIMFLYGGGWSSGDKDRYQFVADTLTQYGYVVVIPDYAKYPPATYPQFVKDAAKAAQWIDENIADYSGNSAAMHIMGHSAGAHTAAMLLVDKHFLAEYGKKPQFFKSFVGLAGPYNFTPTAQKYKKIFGPAERFDQMKANSFVDGSEPPMLLMIGGKDTTVDGSNARKLAEAIREKRGIAEVKLYPTLGHVGIIGQLSPLYGSDTDVVKDAVVFMRRYD